MQNLTDFISALRNNEPMVVQSDASTSQGASFADDLWFESLPTSPVAPTTAVACNKSTIGALNADINDSSGSNRLLVAGATVANHFGEYPSFLLIDRLSHQGGLTSNIASAQTTNLPTAALTRYTNGVGVMIAITIYSQIGTGQGTITATYTNQAGTGSRVTPAVLFPRTSVTGRSAPQVTLLPLQQGDTGVRSVQSVTLSANNGNGTFGVTLFKPLAVFSRNTYVNFNQANFLEGHSCGGIPEVLDNACLTVMGIPNEPAGVEAITFATQNRCVIYLYENTVV